MSQRHDGAIAGALLAAGGSLLFATKGVLAKLMYARGFDYASLVTIRGVGAIPLFWAFAVWRVGLGPFRAVRPAQWWGALLAGFLGYCVGSLLDFYALTLIDASIERSLLFSYPALVVLATAVLERRLPTPGVLLAVALTWVGIVLTVGGFQADLLSANAIGSLAVLGCAATYATYFLMAQRYTREIGSLPFTVLAMTAAGFCLALWHGASGLPIQWPVTPELFGLMAIVIVFATVLPVFMIAEGIRRIGAQRGAIVGTAGPPFTILLSAWLLDERLTLAQLVGTLLIIAGILAVELARGRPVPPPVD